MILLDTNVLSDALRPVPDARVAAWLSGHPRATLFTSTVTRAELLHGVHLLPVGRRREQLLAAIVVILDDGFAGRVLPFDGDAADAYAAIASSRRAAGRPISQCDAMIAAIARSRGAVLATRNTRDFLDCGIDVADPWLA